MTEDHIQITIAGMLLASGVLFFHPANELPPWAEREQPKNKSRYIAALAKRKRMGVQAGVPDIIIVTPPPAVPGAPGAVLEIKTDRGRLSSEQRLWLGYFEDLNWAAACEKGLRACIRRLTLWGYPIVPSHIEMRE